MSRLARGRIWFELSQRWIGNCPTPIDVPREIRAAQSSFEVVKLASAPLLISCGFIKESFNRDSAAVFLPSAMVFGSAAILGAAYALVVTPVLGVVAVAVATKHFYNATVHEGEAEKLRQ